MPEHEYDFYNLIKINDLDDFHKNLLEEIQHAEGELMFALPQVFDKLRENIDQILRENPDHETLSKIRIIIKKMSESPSDLLKERTHQLQNNIVYDFLHNQYEDEQNEKANELVRLLDLKSKAKYLSYEIADFQKFIERNILTEEDLDLLYIDLGSYVNLSEQFERYNYDYPKTFEKLNELNDFLQSKASSKAINTKKLIQTNDETPDEALNTLLSSEIYSDLVLNYAIQNNNTRIISHLEKDMGIDPKKYANELLDIITSSNKYSEPSQKIARVKEIIEKLETVKDFELTFDLLRDKHTNYYGSSDNVIHPIILAMINHDSDLFEFFLEREPTLEFLSDISLPGDMSYSEHDILNLALRLKEQKMAMLLINTGKLDLLANNYLSIAIENKLTEVLPVLAEKYGSLDDDSILLHLKKVQDSDSFVALTKHPQWARVAKENVREIFFEANLSKRIDIIRVLVKEPFSLKVTNHLLNESYANIITKTGKLLEHFQKYTKPPELEQKLCELIADKLSPLEVKGILQIVQRKNISAEPLKQLLLQKMLTSSDYTSLLVDTTFFDTISPEQFDDFIKRWLFNTSYSKHSLPTVASYMSRTHRALTPEQFTQLGIDFLRYSNDKFATLVNHMPVNDSNNSEPFMILLNHLSKEKEFAHIKNMYSLTGRTLSTEDLSILLNSNIPLERLEKDFSHFMASGILIDKIRALSPQRLLDLNDIQQDHNLLTNDDLTKILSDTKNISESQLVILIQILNERDPYRIPNLITQIYPTKVPDRVANELLNHTPHQVMKYLSKLGASHIFQVAMLIADNDFIKESYRQDPNDKFFPYLLQSYFSQGGKTDYVDILNWIYKENPKLAKFLKLNHDVIKDIYEMQPEAMKILYEYEKDKIQPIFDDMYKKAHLQNDDLMTMYFKQNNFISKKIVYTLEFSSQTKDQEIDNNMIDHFLSNDGDLELLLLTTHFENKKNILGYILNKNPTMHFKASDLTSDAINNQDISFSMQLLKASSLYHPGTAESDALLTTLLKQTNIESKKTILQYVIDQKPPMKFNPADLVDDAIKAQDNDFTKLLLQASSPYYKDKSTQDSILTELLKNSDLETKKQLLEFVISEKLNLPYSQNAIAEDLVSTRDPHLLSLVKQTSGALDKNKARELTKIAIENRDDSAIEFIADWGNLNRGTVFVNYDEFMAAGVYTHERFLSRKFTNGLNSDQWADQRALILLSNGQIIEAESDPQYILGLNTAMQMAKSRSPKDPLVTLEEISNQSGIPIEKIGDIDINFVNSINHPYTVEKIVHRPNHDTTHSIRAASHIPVLNEIKGNELDAHRTEALQLMMLFSVLGREDETGFHDSKNGGTYLYQSYRAVSAIEFLTYALNNWENHYKDVFDDVDSLYRAALVVELMGFPKFPDENELNTLNPKPVMLQILEGNSPDNLEHVLSLLSSYPNNNQFKSYTTDRIRSLLPVHKVERSDAQSDSNLVYMNLAHAVELLRIYEPGNPSTLSNSAKNIDTLRQVYNYAHSEFLKKSSSPQAASPAEITIRYFQYVRNLLDAFGEKKVTDVISNEQQTLKLISLCAAVEHFFDQHLPKHPSQKVSFNDIKDLPIKYIVDEQEHVITLNEILKTLNLEDTILTTFNIKPRTVTDKEGNIKEIQTNITQGTIREIMSRYISKNMLSHGRGSHNINRFDYCHYKDQQDLAKTEKFDPNHHTQKDFVKDVESSMIAIDYLVQRPEFCRHSQYPDPKYFDRHKWLTDTIHQQCKDGVALVKLNDKIYIEFSDDESASNVLLSLVEIGLLKQMPTLENGDQNNLHTLASISELDYSLIKPYLKFRLAKPEKTLSVETSLVSSNGDILPLQLINNYEAIGCNHNTITDGKTNQTGLDWYLDQLENPSTQRPFRDGDSPETRSTIADTRDLANPSKMQKRKLVFSRDVHQQPPVTQNPALSDYWQDKDTLIPRDVNQIRGEPKNTLFAKKSSHTLMAPAKQRLFQGIEEKNYFPITIISDINEVHTHGDRFIWSENAGSNEKFWYANKSQRSIYRYDNATNREELIQKLKDAHQTSKDIFSWNEWMVGGSKHAVRALGIPGVQAYNDDAPLTYKLNAITQLAFSKDKYGIDVPLTVNSGLQDAALYDTQAIALDFIKAHESLLNNTYPYMKLSIRNNADEQMLIVQAFETLTGIKNSQALKSYSEYTPDQEIANTIQSNNTIMVKYIKSLNLTPESIQKLANNLNIVGNEARERIFQEKSLTDHLDSDHDNIKYLMVRAVVLGHPMLVDALLQYIQNNNIRIDLLSSPITPNGDTALHLAVKHAQPDMVKKLISLNASTEITNSEGLTPIMQAELLLAETPAYNTNKIEKYNQSKSELTQAPLEKARTLKNA